MAMRAPAAWGCSVCGKPGHNAVGHERAVRIEALALETGEEPLTRNEHRSRRKHAVRATTIAVNKLTKREINETRVHLTVLGSYDRPATRAECADVPRPCPYVACVHNLYLDVSEKTGAIKVNFPDREPDEMPVTGSCALDVADDGAQTLEHVGEIMNVTRERVRQIEERVMPKLRSSDVLRGAHDDGFDHAHDDRAEHLSAHGGSNYEPPKPALTPDEWTQRASLVDRVALRHLVERGLVKRGLVKAKGAAVEDQPEEVDEDAPTVNTSASRSVWTAEDQEDVEDWIADVILVDRETGRRWRCGDLETGEVTHGPAAAARADVNAGSTKTSTSDEPDVQRRGAARAWPVGAALPAGTLHSIPEVAVVSTTAPPSAAAATPANEPRTRSTTMATADPDLTERQQRILDAFRVYVKEHGAEPRPVVLAELAGTRKKGAPSNVGSANVCQVLAVLRTRGLIPAVGELPKTRKNGAIGDGPPPARPKVKAPLAAAARIAKPSRKPAPPAPVDDPLVVQLMERRDALLAKAAKLDALITELTG